MNTFLTSLPSLPPRLRRFFDHVPKEKLAEAMKLIKDDYIMLAENIIISLEEIDSMATKEVNQLKAFSTEPHVKQRLKAGYNL